MEEDLIKMCLSVSPGFSYWLLTVTEFGGAINQNDSRGHLYKCGTAKSFVVIRKDDITHLWAE